MNGVNESKTEGWRQQARVYRALLALRLLPL